jgi:hypothetical protein
MADWYPLATRFPGPAQKVLPGTNSASGIMAHSAVGFRGGLHAVLVDVVSTSKKRTAWHFTVMQDGETEQHYPIDAVLGHAADWGGDNDGVNGNGTLIGIEHEGGFSPANEPLTPAQRSASVALVKWIAKQGGWAPSRTTKKTLWEHREISDTGTLCPSDRIPWGYYLISEAKPLTTDQQSLLDWLATAAGQRLDLSTRNRLLTEAGLSTDAAPAPTAPTPPQPAPVPPQPSSTNEAALRAIADIKRATAALEAALKG